MSQYVDIAYVKLNGCMPSEDIDALEARYPGVVDAMATGISGFFDSMLQKRYAAPFATPFPDSLRWNVAQVVCHRLMMKRGFNPSSQQDQQIKAAADLSLSWLRDAADPQKGLVELPVKQQALGTGGVSAGAPLAYSEASPYSWVDQQRCTIAGGGR